MPAAFSSLKLQCFSVGADSVAGISWIKDNTEQLFDGLWKNDFSMLNNATIPNFLCMFPIVLKCKI